MLIGLPLLMCRSFRGAGTTQKFYSPISINSGQVPSAQTDFPVLVSVTDNRFKTVANGGHVDNGYDIRPYSDSSLTVPITGYELERYDGSTGEVVMWVKVASLTSSSTPIYLGYGDSTLTSDGSSTSTWSNGFLGVYHLADGTTLNVNSSTGSNNGTNHGATATSGNIDGGGNFVRSSLQYIDLGTGMHPDGITLSAWIKYVTLVDYTSVVNRGASSVDYYGFYVKSTGKLYMLVRNTGGTSINYDGTGSHTLSSATWYYVCLTYDSSAGLVGYVNAESDHTVGANGTINQTSANTNVGRQASTATRYWNGVIDEVRLSDVARSADWVTTEYNNQSAPGTFETLETEVSL